MPRPHNGLIPLVLAGLFLLCGVGAGAAQISGNLRILPGSSLSVEGRSNVNSFRYVYEGLPSGDGAEAIGDVSQVAASLLKDTLALKIAEFDSGNSHMNRDFLHLLHAKEHPDIRIEIVSLAAYDSAGERVDILDDRVSQLWVRARFTIAGVTHLDLFPVDVKHSADGMSLAGGLTVNINDYGLEAPTVMLGLIRVDRHITISFDLHLQLLAKDDPKSA